MIREFFIRGHYLGKKEVAEAWGGSQAESSLSRSSFSFVSPNTGDVWAKSPLIYGGHQKPFFIFTKPGVGEGHRTDYGPSGSLLSAGYWIIQHLTIEVLRLELLIHCDWAMSRPTNLEEFLSCLTSQPLPVPTSC